MSNFFPEPKVITVRDVAVNVSPLAVKNLGKAAKCATPLLSAFKDGQLDPMVVLNNVDVVIELVSIATGQDEEWVGNLNAAEMLVLLTAVIQVNMDFFSLTILPQLQGMVKTVETISKTPIQTP